MPLMVVKIGSSGQTPGGSAANHSRYFSLQTKEHLRNQPECVPAEVTTFTSLALYILAHIHIIVSLQLQHGVPIRTER